MHYGKWIGIVLCAFLLGLIIGKWFSKKELVGEIRINNCNMDGYSGVMFFNFLKDPSSYPNQTVEMRVVVDHNLKPGLGKNEHHINDS